MDFIQVTVPTNGQAPTLADKTISGWAASKIVADEQSDLVVSALCALLQACTDTQRHVW
jgi:hypothetical protein